MSRSGYSDDLDPLVLGRWRAAVKSAIGGKRGQAMLRDLLVALDAMPVKSLVADSLVNAEGQYCTLGALGHARGLDMSQVDPEDYDAVAEMFGVNAKVVQEIVFENDERNYRFTSKRRQQAEVGPPVPNNLRWVRYELDEGAERWREMRTWVEQHIKQPATATQEACSE